MVGETPQLAIDRARVEFVGPYDFAEKDYHEPRSVLDYVQITAVLATLPFRVLLAVVVSRFNRVRGRRPLTIRESAWETTMWHVARNTTWTQLHILTPLRPLRQELALGAYVGLRKQLPGFNYYFGGTSYSARWLTEVPDRQPGDPVVLYMHGGSYALKVQRPQISFMGYVALMFRDARISILVLDYTIAPFAKHPTQLYEAAACYDDLAKSSKNIVYFGDSAGGHMALALLLLGKLAKGVMLVSPSTDMADVTDGRKSMRDVYLDNGMDPTDPLVSPVRADPSEWKRVLPHNTAMVWGSFEDSKHDMSKFAKIAGIAATFEEVEGSHDCILRGPANLGSQFIIRELSKWLAP